MTIDGRVASDSGDSKWISGPESRLEVHRMRARTDAVVVGAGTLRADDPVLTARGVECKRQPLRVVVDPGLSVQQGAALVRTVGEGPVLIVCSESVAEARQEVARSWGLEVLPVPGHVENVGAAGEDGNTMGDMNGSRPKSRSRPDPAAVARALAARGIQTVLLEGGPTLAGAWWAAGLVDRVVAFVSPRVLSGTHGRSPLRGEGGVHVADAVQLREVEVRHFGADICLSGYVSEAF
jgi:diaminohydroxyphosphoribosylaminopyrimidine deaminase/5-amino-6-(5-phosphoribosylamino)uracil reductase